jgi:hypothetical protein
MPSRGSAAGDPGQASESCPGPGLLEILRAGSCAGPCQRALAPGRLGCPSILSAGTMPLEWETSWISLRDRDTQSHLRHPNR